MSQTSIWFRRPLKLGIILPCLIFFAFIPGIIGMFLDEYGFVLLIVMGGLLLATVILLTCIVFSPKNHIRIDETGIEGYVSKQFHWDWASIILVKYKKDKLNFPAIIYSRAPRLRTVIVWFTTKGEDEEEIIIELDEKRIVKITQLCPNEDLKNQLLIALDKSWSKIKH